jgi:hypothetical protein
VSLRTYATNSSGSGPADHPQKQQQQQQQHPSGGSQDSTAGRPTDPEEVSGAADNMAAGTSDSEEDISDEDDISNMSPNQLRLSTDPRVAAEWDAFITPEQRTILHEQLTWHQVRPPCVGGGRWEGGAASL